MALVLTVEELRRRVEVLSARRQEAYETYHTYHGAVQTFEQLLQEAEAKEKGEAVLPAPEVPHV